MPEPHPRRSRLTGTKQFAQCTCRVSVEPLPQPTFCYSKVYARRPHVTRRVACPNLRRPQCHFCGPPCRTTPPHLPQHCLGSCVPSAPPARHGQCQQSELSAHGAHSGHHSTRHGHPSPEVQPCTWSTGCARHPLDLMWWPLQPQYICSELQAGHPSEGHWRVFFVPKPSLSSAARSRTCLTGLRRIIPQMPTGTLVVSRTTAPSMSFNENWWIF